MKHPAHSLKVELVSSAMVTRLCRKLAHKIQDSGFNPDIVICIARGGYIPARLICDYLNRASSESKTGNKNNKIGAYSV